MLDIDIFLIDNGRIPIFMKMTDYGEEFLWWPCLEAQTNCRGEVVRKRMERKEPTVRIFREVDLVA